MTELTLNDVNQDQFNAAELALIALIRSKYPTLDLRSGTVLRDTLVRTDASIAALHTAQVEQLRRLMSLPTIVEDGTAEAEDLNKILANFNMTQNTGSAATGRIKIKVDSARTYTLAPGTVFATFEGLQFQTADLVVALTTPGAGETQLYANGDGSYHFLADVVAMAEGSAYNIAQGTALDPVSSMYGYVSASAYTNFTTGLDGETVQEAVTRIPAALSHRALTNRTAVEAMLRARFEGTATAIQAIAVQGMGDDAMRRDKHNVFGVAVGGRSDVYVRTFTAPSVLVLEKTGTRTGDGTYSFEIGSDAPGFYAIRSIGDKAGAVASYSFTETRTQSDDTTWHDLLPADVPFTVFQTSTVTVTGVPDTMAEHAFAVEVWDCPGLASIQTYVDDDSVRNIAADVVVRCPPICLVACRSTIYYDLATPPDLTVLASKLAAYVNSRSYTGMLTRSELVSVLLANGVKRVALDPDDMLLTGRVLGSDGVWRTLRGDKLAIADIADAGALLTPDTVVFAAELQDIQFTAVGE